MRALRLHQASPSPDAVSVQVVEQSRPVCGPTEALVRVRMAAVNPSDVKASLGHMPQAVWPRTSGRDYVGVVEQGPPAWEGKTVFGSGGDVGITRDGSHAGWLVLPVRALLEKPAALSDAQAASMGVPYVTALRGFEKAGYPEPGEPVLVAGAMGKVGLAAAAIAKMRGARVFGVKRAASSLVAGHACDEVFDLEDTELAAKLLERTGGKGVSLVFNTVGSPYLPLALDVLALHGRQVLISTLDRNVPFDIFKFFRKELDFYGVDTLKLDAVSSNALLARLVPHVSSGRLSLPEEDRPQVYTLDQAAEAFHRTFVQGGVGLFDLGSD